MGRGKELKDSLNVKQLRFCQLYVTQDFFGNGTESYIEAYELDRQKQGSYENAKSGASTLLTNPNILKRINASLDSEGLNDAFVDKQLLFLITQNAEFAAKVSAIREYNKLKQRITEKTQITIKKVGKELQDEQYE